ncbi:phosphopantothenoylcysteine decarboxylase domain-containing protein [Botrimarina hoheduenensis]|uniref:Coenzyme A biosynthesis bifunctional protein CoaBC n=1 Tax=Botrimarina hoheduenensis TaxID=2528000 RepID=A0A5C5WDF8_9BACT|nr:phosphopantothenoylcysteine decarboxylase [Botrimarina hoheduenensis]TWT48670.1 Coenzyme A biosynthesis bifunctional protein CoaBC [Botrimarina hoheduenensis]
MAKILITSGPTRQYIDAVRYLTNASSGRMGRGLAAAALAAGNEVVIVSGPVEVEYPAGARVVWVVSTEEMLAVATAEFEACDGLIGAAAPCDYRPVHVEPGKIAKTGEPLQLNLVETDDVVATLGAKKQGRWVVGFALETEDHRLRALAKLERKHCDLMVSNGVEAMNAETNTVEVLTGAGQVVGRFTGPKDEVAQGILGVIHDRLIG